MKAALLDSFLAVYTRYGLVWYGPTDWHDLSYRLAMRLAGLLNTVLVLPDELAPDHRRQAAFEASEHIADQLIRLGETHPAYWAWEMSYLETSKEYLACARALA
jgi:hypothetical protein